MMNPYMLIGMIVALGAAVRGNWSPCGESLQAQLHPLGERSRGNVWLITVLAFGVASAAAGAALGGISGWLGGLFPGGPGAVSLAAVLAVVAGALDLSRLRPPTPRRQVNENWIGRYRGWVYGAGFGIQLGLGFTVFVMSWGYYAMLAIAFVSASPLVGLAIGATFGLGRGLLLYLSRRIETPESLVSFHSEMARLKTPVFRSTGYVSVILGVLTLGLSL